VSSHDHGLVIPAGEAGVFAFCPKQRVVKAGLGTTEGVGPLSRE